VRYPTQSRHIAEDRAIAQGGRGQFSRWIARHKEFREEYTLAHEFRAEDLAEEMVEIADDPSVLVETIAPHDGSRGHAFRNDDADAVRHDGQRR
jgi:hypothetical protein